MKPIIFLSLLIAFPNSVFAWGQTGHRITGAIASKHLSDSAKVAVESILPNETLSEASTYADEMRSNPSEYWQKTASPFHYVTVAEGQEYKRAPKHGDSVSALKHFKKYFWAKRQANPKSNSRYVLRFI
ncbi:MAG: hypothetical protein JKY88_06005 [Pseudomonadales bacterium]|nr:hypothetical protein [Pseudomonadales bacterium]